MLSTRPHRRPTNLQPPTLFPPSASFSANIPPTPATDRHPLTRINSQVSEYRHLIATLLRRRGKACPLLYIRTPTPAGSQADRKRLRAPLIGVGLQTKKLGHLQVHCTRRCYCRGMRGGDRAAAPSPDGGRWPAGRANGKIERRARGVGQRGGGRSRAVCIITVPSYGLLGKTNSKNNQ